MKTKSNKIKFLIMISSIILFVCFTIFILHYTSIEQKIIRSCSNNIELYDKLIEDLSNYRKNTDDDVFRIDIEWNSDDKESNGIMCTNLVNKVAIDKNIYNDLDIILDTINTSKKMFIQVFFNQERVTEVFISIAGSEYKRDDVNGGTWYYSCNLIYSVFPIESLNISSSIIKSKQIDGNWYYAKERTSIG